jgi:hypothetical protein
MATYTLISSNVLASTANSILFSSIPSTYTDLAIKISARSTLGAGETGTFYMVLNGDEGAVNTYYSRTVLTGNGASATSSRAADQAPWVWGSGITANGATSNTFSNIEYYIPNYAGTNAKVLSGIEMSQNNATTAYINARAGLYRGTPAITSIEFKQTTFAIGSSFYLYGISNA